MKAKIWDKAVKWDITNKKIKQIIIDLYKSQPAYKKILKSMRSFLDKYEQQVYIWWSEIYLNSEGEFYGEISSSWIATGGIPTVKNDRIERIPLDEAFPLLPPFLCGSEYRTLNKISNTRFKVQDIQEKYNISNVTIKARLSAFFKLERVFEGKIGYLNLILRYDIMLALALYEILESSPSEKENSFKEFFDNFSSL